MTKEAATVDDECENDETSDVSSSKAEASSAKLVEALATGLSHAQAGRVAGVSKRTVARRVADPAFSARVEQRRVAMVDEVVGQLGMLGLRAVEVIHEFLSSGEDVFKYRASVDVLRLLLPYRRHNSLEMRIAAVEQSLNGAGNA